MSTRTTGALLILVVSIVVVVNSYAAAGIGFAEPNYEDGTHSQPGVELVTSTSDAFDHTSSSDTVLSSLSAVTSVVFLAGYDRSTDSDPLEHELREEIHDRIHRASGIYASDLGEAFDVHRSTLRYHLQILEREGLISSESMFGKRWCQPPGSDGAVLSAALANDATGEIVEAIARLEPVNVTNLANELERSASTVSYHLDRLEDKGLVEQEQHSTTVLSRLAPDVSTELGSSTSSTNQADSLRE